VDPWAAKRSEDGVGTREAGFTLIELLVAMTVFIGVLGTTLSVLVNASRGVTKDQVRTDSAMDAQLGVARMVRELRETYDVIDMTGSVMDVYARLRGSNVRLRYDCDVAFTPDDPANPYDQDYRRCVRRTAPVVDPTSSTPPTLPDISTGTVIVDRICPGTASASCTSAASAPVFTCRTSPAVPSAPCAALPPPPPDPDNPVDPDEPLDPVWPTLVEINIQVPARGASKNANYSHRISFSDGVLLRSLDLKYANDN
jgi:type II secretory pathway pseudopilin PulG